MGSQSGARAVRKTWVIGFFALCLALWSIAEPAVSTPFTTTVPGTSLVLPAEYPQAGGVAIVMVGANGNAYYQFSNPTGAFIGYQNTGNPAGFRGNPFTINSPISLNCGFSSCATYFGGSIAQVYIRFTALDGDTQVGGFDYNDITLRLNGYDVANWSGITTQTTNTAGTTALSSQQGFGNNTFDTGWFSSTNPALLGNILSTGKTTTQVYDQDPNDNYWDFSIGGSLANNNIITVAPGYSLTKTANTPTFTAVGQVITYTYVVTNIGSVPIRSLTVSDDKIAAISCSKNVILSVPSGSPAADFATCTGTYTVTQADFDAEKVTNIAKANGVPDFGTLGGLTATVTVTGPVTSPAITLQKTSTLTAFGAVGTSVPYAFRVQNSGNATLTNVVVSDPKVPGLSCTFATMAPAAVQTCTGSYTVTQADMDAFAKGTNLVNTASVTSRDPKNVARTATAVRSLPGPTPVLTMFMDKTTTATSYNTAGQVLPYQILVRNTGNITWPAAPTVTDSKTSVTCPAGAVAPGASITCSANYTVLQADIDAGTLLNTANGSITVGSRTATATDAVTLTATRTTGLTIDKRLSPTSPSSFNDTAVALSYVYELKNTGNVTLNTVAVTDNKTTVTCPVAILAPAATTLCTASYATLQADLNAGSVVNIASASAKAAGTAATVLSTSDTVTVPALQQPALTMTKTAPAVTGAQFVVGGVVTYSYAVTNAGNTDILAATQVTVTDDKIGTFNCGSGIFLRGTTRTCTANYTLTSADVLAGLVVNKATSKAGTTTSNQVTATIAPSLNPAITLAKSASPASVSALSDVITYTFTITNTGNTQIIKSGQPITVNDPLLGAVDCSAQPATMVNGDFFACTKTYSPTQAQLDAGSILNTATASFPFTSGSPTVTTTITSASSQATVPVVETASLTLDKTGPANFTAVGQVISYGFAVRNTGNTTLTSTTVTDPKLPTLACTLTTIAPGVTKSCTGSYTVTQADMDAGSIANTASAQGSTAAGGSAVGSDTVTTPVAPTVVLKSATLAKLASPTTFTAVGQTITYTMRVSNTGAQTLRNITVTDVLDAAYSCDIPVLAPGATNATCTYAHTVTQADLNTGNVVNTASAASPDFTTLTDSKTVTGPVRSAAFTFVKAASGPFAVANDVVDFTFTVKNTGNVTLSNVLVTDAFFSPSLSCTIPSLLPGATDTSCSASYTVTQADVDRGSITNTASATAVPPAGVTAPAAKTSTVVVDGPDSAPKVTITKTPSVSAYASVSNVINYTFTVTNSGNVTLGNLTVSDTALGFTCGLSNLAPGASTTVCAGGSPALSASKTIAQSDIDLGTFTNTARVTGQSLVGAVAVSDTDVVIVNGPVQAPAISMIKDSTLVGPLNRVGQVVPYTYTITNNGNITLTGNFTVADNKISTVACANTPAAGVPPGASLICTANYVVKQADLDAGQIVNLATASITQPVIPANPGDPSIVTVDSAQVSETVVAVQLPKLVLDKHVLASSVSSYAAVNDTVTFEYVVTNMGNVTTTAPITIADDKIGSGLSCGATGLAPGASVTCTHVWTADQAAVDAGLVTNSAFATTIYKTLPVNSVADKATVTAVQTPKLAIAKTFSGTSAPGFFNVGDMLSYDIVVTNTGNVTIDGPIVLTDSLTTPVCSTPLPGNKLAPLATYVCTASHTVTQNDVDLGAAVNVVSAAAEFDGVPVVSPSADARYPVAAAPALSLTKAAVSGSIPFTAAGQQITYRYTVDNTGNVSLTQAIFITDDKLGGGPRQCRAAAVFTTNDPPITCDFPYTVTQADVDRGFVTNNAVASTVFAPNGPATQVVSPNAAATVLATEDPELTVVKAVVAGPSPAVLGSVLTYRVTTTNTGNQTIAGVTVADPKVGALSCTVGGSAAPANVVLLPTQALVCEADYTVTQADVDAQTLVNTATARGADPQGATVSKSGNVTHPLVAPLSSVEVTKAITPPPGPDDAFASVGQPVTFTVTVRNTGNVTLTSTNVTDPLDLTTGTCVVGSLAPGATDTTCTFVVIATQAHIDAAFGTPGDRFGGFLNTVSAVSQPANPGATTVTDTGETFAKGPARTPALSLAKVALTSAFDAFGDVITYEFTVANAGNVTLLEPILVNDPLLGAPFACGTLPVGGLAPREFITCTRTYSAQQIDVDAGVINNTAKVSSSEVPFPTGSTPVDALAKARMTSGAQVLGARTPGLSVVKSASVPADAVVDDVIDYSYTVTNTGNVSLTAVTLSDQHTSAGGTVALAIAGDAPGVDLGEQDNSTDAAANGVWDNLGPGDSATFTASYTVTQADIDAGDDIANTVSVSSSSPSGTTPPSATDSVSVSVAASVPAMLSLKTVDASGLSVPPVAGDVLNYTITVENTGNTTLSSITLTDTLRDAGGTPILPKPVPVFSSGDDGDGVLDVGETWIYLTSFTLTQSAVDAGGVANSVVTSARDPFATAITDTSDDDGVGASDPTTTAFDRTPRIAVTKAAVLNSGTNGRADVGDTVTYTYVVSNPGNVTLFDFGLTETGFSGTGTLPVPVRQSGGANLGGNSAKLDLAVGATATFTVDYALTQADVDAGKVDNQATAVAKDPAGGDVSDLSGPDASSDTVTATPLTSAPKMDVQKRVSTSGLSSPVTAGDVLDYSITVANTGNVTLSSVVLTDTFRDGANTQVLPKPVPVFSSGDDGDALLEVGETWTYLVSHTLTQAEIDTGGVSNAVVAAAKTPALADVADTSDDDGTGNSDPTKTTLTPVGKLTVLKTANTSALTTPVSPGDVISYVITVKNSGNVTLSALALTDTPTNGASASLTLTSGPTFVSGDTGADSIFGVNETWRYSASYTLTQADIDSGLVANSAVANAKTPAGADVTDTSDNGGGGASDPTTTPLVRTPALSAVKVSTLNLGTDNRASAGDTIDYQYTVANAGNVTLLDITLAETAFTGSGPTPVPAYVSGGAILGGEAALRDLAVGQSMIFAAQYVLTQDDIDQGFVDNQATVSADAPDGSSVTDKTGDTAADDAVTKTVLPATPALEAVKTADISGLSSPVVAGDAISFTVTVENLGNVSLTNVSLADTFRRRDGSALALTPAFISGDGGVVDTLDVGETWTYSASYTLTQGDINAGGVENQVDATAQAPDGLSVSDTSDDGDDTDGNSETDPTVVAITGEPAITVEKALAAGSTAPFDRVGQVLDYEFTVTNRGNITLTAAIVVSDPLVEDAGGLIDCPVGPVAPGASVVCAGSYTVTQSDLDRGTITNTASAAVDQPVVPAKPGDPTSVTSTDDSDPVIATADQQTELALTKSIAASSASSFAAVGDVVRFEYVLKNTGNVTLTGPLTVADDKISGTLVCGPGPLLPGASLSCAQNWIATQADLDQVTGEVTNIATGTATFRTATVTSNTDSATITAVQDPSLAVEKTLTSAVPDLFDEGTVLTYGFLITNDGNVTIDGPISIADSLTSVTCDPTPVAGLLPGETLSCTASYTLRPADIRLGSTTNVANAAGSFAGVAVTSPSDSVIYPVTAAPVLSMVKNSTPANASFAALGDIVDYSYTVTNSGKVGLTEDIIVTDNRLAAPFVCRPASAGVFSVGAEVTCAASYTVTQADLDAGFVTNEAIASTVFAPDSPDRTTVSSPAATKTVPAVEDPKLTVVKTVTAGADPAAAGDVISYQIVATNSGNQTLRAVSITDARLATLTCSVASVPAGPSVTLAPKASLVCTGDYTVTQADVDAQSLTNTATAAGNDPDGARVTSDDSVSHPVDLAVPALSVVKSLVPNPGTGPAFSAPGKVLTFAVTVQNDGNTTLTNLLVTDDLVPGTCTIATLVPAARNSTCRFEYITTQADVDAVNGTPPRGGFVNTATVVATPANPGAPNLTQTDTLDVIGPVHAPAFTLAKSADVAQAAAFGDVINYTYLVTNSGNITLRALPVVSDDKIANVLCPALPADGLAPNASISCTAAYSVTQADVEAGFVTNNASVGSPEVTTPATDTVTVPITRLPGLTVAKTASIVSDAKVGDTIDYTYRIENTGNTLLTSVALDDQHTSAAGTVALVIAGDALVTDAAEQDNSTDADANGVWDNLGPGDVVTFSASYTVTQADIDAGTPISNTVTVNADGPEGPLPVPPTDTVDVPVVAPVPSLDVLKTVDLGSLSSPPVAGEVLTYAITVRNSGNVTLARVTLADTLRRADGTALALGSGPTLVSGDTGLPDIMEIDETWTYSAQYTLTQADVDAGGLSNQVRATAKAPSGALVTDLSDDGVAGGTDDPTRTVIAATPKIVGEKTVVSAALELGGIVEFLITAENTGNVSLDTVSVASDTLQRADGTVLALTSGPGFIGATKGSGAGMLLPGEIARYSATYVLTQDDIDAGGITNSAVVSGKPPSGPPVTDITDNGEDGDGNTTDDKTTVTVPSIPALRLTKQLASGSGPTFATAGQELEFEFVVTNTGNVTFPGPVVVNDPLIVAAGGNVVCPVGALAPLATLTCTGVYAVTQADIDSGSVTNTATASTGTTTSPQASRTVPASRRPALSLVKASDPVPAEDFVVGVVVNYTYTITNSGNVTITAPITVSDNRIAANDISCPALPAGGLLPAAELTCVATYTVTSDDVALGSVTNLATATDGTTVSPIATKTIPNNGTPALTLVKTAESGQDFDAVGDVISYQYTVTNAGTRAFVAPVTVVDDKLGEVACFAPTVGNPDFIPGETIVCTADYTVTQADVDAGTVTNQAYGRTTFGGGNVEVVSAPDVVTVTAPQDPQISLSKSSTPNPVAAVGETVTYSLNAVNSGNQTLRNVEVTDPMLPGLECVVGILLPAQSLQCDATYVVTQADVDRGTLVNTANVAAINPQGSAATDTATETTGMPAANPGVTLEKTAIPSPFGAAGTTLTYGFAITNTGNVTLTDLEVSDPMVPDYTCTIAQLAPGARNATCQLAVTVTQAQVDAGSIANSASVSGKTPGGGTTSGEDSISTMGPASAPGIEATKVLLPSGSALGSVVQYELLVRNTGNVTLTPTAPVDTMQRLNNTPTALDAAFALVSGDTNTNALLEIDETWRYAGSHILTQTDIDAGGLSNSVNISATALGGAAVSDVSDNGNDGDGNSTDDPTVFSVLTGPALEVTKVVTSQGSGIAGSPVVFTITAVNTGAVTLADISISDQMQRLDGTPISSQVPQGGATSLIPGEVATWTLEYVLTQADIDAGGIQNSAIVSGKAPDGSPVSDISDNGEDGDGNITDDATVVVVNPGPDLEVTKTIASQTGLAAGDTVVFQIAAVNTGGVTLRDLTISDNLTRADGSVIAGQVPTGGADSLVPGETAIWTLSYVLSQVDVDAGGIQNSAVVGANGPNGGPISDVSDNGDDGDGNTTNDPTVLVLAPAPALDVTKVVAGITGTKVGDTVSFTITAVNSGNVSLTDIAVVDTMTRADGTAIPGQVPVGGATSLAPGESTSWTLDYVLTQADINAGGIRNSAAVSGRAPDGASVRDVSDNGDDGDGNAVDDPTAVVIVPPTDGLATATKTADRTSAVYGETITYTIALENASDRNFVGADIVDLLPAGLQYTPGSAVLNGVATEPQINGNQLRFGPIDLAPAATASLRLSVRVVSKNSFGKLTNTAWMEDQTGVLASNRATATVKIQPEAVFDCTDVIGKVFDDFNRNGYQDGPAGLPPLTDDDVFVGGKYGKFSTPKPLPKGYEPGLPGVRLATVNGLLITTDDFGRFHVPCAALPRSNGSNFTLKLDPRSLPEGYLVTTENPRVLRVTPGKVAKMNFGAALANVIDIDLTAAAFDPATGQPSDAFAKAVKGLVKDIKAKPTALRLGYLMQKGENADQAMDRLRAAEKVIRKAWRGVGSYPLSIQRQVDRVQ